MNKDYDTLYDELVEVSKRLYPYFGIDKIKDYGVYVWEKTNDGYGRNVFDVFKDYIYVYEKLFKIPKEVIPTIIEIQNKLTEIDDCLSQEENEEE